MLTTRMSQAGPEDQSRMTDSARLHERYTIAYLIIACYAQLRLARGLAAEIRLPWQRPCPPGQLTQPGSAAGSATSARPCPATRHDVGKTVKRDDSKKKERRHKAFNNKLRACGGSHGRRADRVDRRIRGANHGSATCDSW